MPLAYYSQLLGQALTAGTNCTLSGVVEDVNNASAQVFFTSASNAQGTIQIFKNDDNQYASPSDPIGAVPAYRKQLASSTAFGPVTTTSGFFTSVDTIDFRNMFVTVNMNTGSGIVDIVVAGHSASKPS